MTRHTFLRALCLFTVLLLLPHAGASAPANAKPLRDIVITMRAETVLASLQKILPLTIPSQHPGLQGDIVLESLDRLSIADNVLSVHGVLSGKNLVMATNLAGQNIQLKLGQVPLPIHWLYRRISSAMAASLSTAPSLLGATTEAAMFTFSVIKAAVIGPSRRPTCPTSRLGSQCTAKTASTPSSEVPDMVPTTRTLNCSLICPKVRARLVT